MQPKRDIVVRMIMITLHANVSTEDLDLEEANHGQTNRRHSNRQFQQRLVQLLPEEKK